jgi:hypothetical protein
MIKTHCLNETFFEKLKLIMEANLKTISYIDTLEYRRDNLKKAIKQELKSPSRDEMKINALKKYSLRLKDEIMSMRKQA